MKKLLAPNGKPSNLNEKQYKLVRTPAFKKWFGDWENDPENSSKVIDVNGEPLPVYHGSSKSFNIFKTGVFGEIHFIDYKEYSTGFGEYIYECFLNIRNPFLVKKNYNEIPKGFDGTIFKNFIKSKYEELSKKVRYAVFNPNQIKLADGSNTTFDANNDDIRYAGGGETRTFTDDGNKLVVYQTKDYKISVDDINNAKYISLWFVNPLFDLDVKVGHLALSKTEDGFLKVQEIDIQKQHRGKGFSTLMYLMALKYSSENIKGIKSYLPDRVNKRQVPKIYKKLNGKNIGDWAYIFKSDNLENFKNGGRTIAQTPAPKKERIYGSNTNKINSSKSNTSAKQIVFDEKTIKSIKNKVDKHNKENPNKLITLSSAKAVVRRGMGAYSSSHRPTIKGGKPNSRVAWGLARLNAFIYKIKNGVSKSGKYTQDDDLIKELNIKYNIGGEISKQSINNVKNDKINYINIINNIWSFFGIKLD